MTTPDFTSCEVWRACSALLNYVEDASAEKPMTPQTLLRHLDAVAFAMHDIGNVDDVSDDDEPPYERATYKWVGERGPFLSLYDVVISGQDRVGEPDMGVGDACDDVMDILNDLRGARAWLEAGSSADAQHHLTLLFFHWGQHLRGLQTFLWSLLFEQRETMGGDVYDSVSK